VGVRFDFDHRLKLEFHGSKATSTLLNGSLESNRSTEEARPGDENPGQNGFRIRPIDQNRPIEWPRSEDCTNGSETQARTPWV
jgi:hypothetical protein